MNSVDPKVLKMIALIGSHRLLLKERRKFLHLARGAEDLFREQAKLIAEYCQAGGTRDQFFRESRAKLGSVKCRACGSVTPMHSYWVDLDKLSDCRDCGHTQRCVR